MVYLSMCRERIELERGCLEVKQELAAVQVTLQQVCNFGLLSQAASL